MSDFVRDMAERLYRRPKSHLLNERTPTKTRCGLVAAQCAIQPILGEPSEIPHNVATVRFSHS